MLGRKSCNFYRFDCDAHLIDDPRWGGSFYVFYMGFDPATQKFNILNTVYLRMPFKTNRLID